MRIIDVASCKQCRYFRGSFWAAHANDRAQIINSNEVVSGSCYHPLQIDSHAKPRSIMAWTEFINDFPVWCELEEKEV